MAFPSLSRRPIEENVLPVENVIKHDTESDVSVYRRKKRSRDKYSWTLNYDLLFTTDANALISHWQSVGQHTSFTWTDKTGTNRTVFFDAILTWVELYPGCFKFSQIKLMEK
jgi:hypothetical protein